MTFEINNHIVAQPLGFSRNTRNLVLHSSSAMSLLMMEKTLLSINMCYFYTYFVSDISQRYLQNILSVFCSVCLNEWIGLPFILLKTKIFFCICIFSSYENTKHKPCLKLHVSFTQIMSKN